MLHMRERSKPLFAYRKPSNTYDIAISPYHGPKENIPDITANFYSLRKASAIYTLNPRTLARIFRDICKHIVNGLEVVNAIG